MPVEVPVPCRPHPQGEMRRAIFLYLPTFLVQFSLRLLIVRPAPWAGRGGLASAGLRVAEAGCPHSSTHLGWAAQIGRAHV